MTTDELRRELDRIADSAPAAGVPDDTWTRARRSVARDRVAVGGAALAVVAAVAAVVTWLPDGVEPPVADSESGAIPSRIWTVDEDTSLPVRDDLAVGPVSAAYLDQDSSARARLVAVSARDGTYRTLTLPGPDGEDAVQFGWEDQVVQLSPDGRQLAYNFFPGNGDRGVGVVDLITGEVRIIRLDIGSRGFVRRLIWSPGGQYLIWWGQPHTSQGFGNTMAGLIGPGAITSTTLPEERQDETRGYAVDDEGRVALIDPSRVRTWQDGRIVETQRVDLGSTWSESAQLVDDGLVEVRRGEEQDLMVRHGARSEDSPFPTTLTSRSILGWTSDGAAIVEGEMNDELAIDSDLYRVELGADGEVTTKLIVTYESNLDPEGITVASDLPVEDFPDPEWAEEPWWGIDPSLLIGLGVAGAIAVLMGLRWGWRRYLFAKNAS